MAVMTVEMKGREGVGRHQSPLLAQPFSVPTAKDQRTGGRGRTVDLAWFAWEPGPWIGEWGGVLGDQKIF